MQFYPGWRQGATDRTIHASPGLGRVAIIEKRMGYSYGQFCLKGHFNGDPGTKKFCTTCADPAPQSLGVHFQLLLPVDVDLFLLTAFCANLSAHAVLSRSYTECRFWAG